MKIEFLRKNPEKNSSYHIIQITLIVSLQVTVKHWLLLNFVQFVLSEFARVSITMNTQRKLYTLNMASRMLYECLNMFDLRYVTTESCWFFTIGSGNLFNTFLANASILYPLKSPENLWFSGIFRGYKMGILVRNGLISTEKQREPRQVANNLLETKSSCIMQYFFPMFSWNFAQCLSDLYCRFSSHLWEANFL